MDTGTTRTPTTPGPTGLKVVETAIELVRDIDGAVHHIRGRHGNLVDQLQRAAESVVLNLAEGAGRAGKDKPYHYNVAYASAGEAGTALRLLAAYRVLDPRGASDLLQRLDQVRAIAWRLIHPE